MTPQFKTFLKFAVLVVFLIAVPIIGDKIGEDIAEVFVLPAILVFLIFLWRTMSKHKPEVAIPNIENGQGGALQYTQERGRGKQIFLSILITLIGIVAIVSIFGPLTFTATFNYFPDLIKKYRLYPFLVAVALTIIFFICWLKSFIDSISNRNNAILRKRAEWKIVIFTIVAGISICLAIASIVIRTVSLLPPPLW